MKPLLIAMAFARALDVHSTCLGLQRGGEELNPLLPGTCRAQIYTQAGIGVGETVALVKLRKTNPTLAKVLVIVQIAVSGTVAAHNYQLAHGLGR